MSIHIYQFLGFRFSNHILHFTVCILLLTISGHAQSVTGEPAVIPELNKKYEFAPWEDPTVTSINRQPSRATAYSYTNIEDALKGNRTKNRQYLISAKYSVRN